MTEPWWVRAPALPPFFKCLYSGVRVLVSTLIYLNVRSFGLLVISRFRSFHHLSPVFRCCKRKELPFLVPLCSDYFLSFVGKAVDKVASLQDRLGGLGNSQVELHLLRSCLGVCKLNHLLHTISPNCVISQLERFDYNLRSALGRICKSSISDLSWLQATLPCSMGGLGLREATSTSSAAFLGSCFSSQELYYRLLQSFSGGPDMFPSIPDQDVATSILLPLINSDSLPDLIHPACGSVFSNMNLILLVRPFCLIHLPFGTEPEFVQFLLTPVPVHGFGPFLVIL